MNLVFRSFVFCVVLAASPAFAFDGEEGGGSLPGPPPLVDNPSEGGLDLTFRVPVRIEGDASDFDTGIRLVCRIEEDVRLNGNITRRTGDWFTERSVTIVEPGEVFTPTEPDGTRIVTMRIPQTLIAAPQEGEQRRGYDYSCELRPAVRGGTFTDGFRALAPAGAGTQHRVTGRIFGDGRVTSRLASELR